MNRIDLAETNVPTRLIHNMKDWDEETPLVVETPKSIYLKMKKTLKQTNESDGRLLPRHKPGKETPMKKLVQRREKRSHYHPKV